MYEAHLMMPSPLWGKDPWGRTRLFGSEQWQLRHAKTKEFAEEWVKEVLQDYQAEMSQPTKNMLVDRAARLACSIYDMRAEHEVNVGALEEDDDQGYDNLVSELFEKKNTAIKEWKKDPAWGEGGGIKKVKTKCLSNVIDAIDEARDSMLDSEAEREEEEEIEEFCREREEEEAAIARKRSDKAGLKEEKGVESESEDGGSDESDSEEEGSNEARPHWTRESQRHDEVGSLR